MSLLRSNTSFLITSCYFFEDLFRLWMDSIHCYCRLDVDKSTSDDNKITSDNLDPPVVIVGTWKDAVISEEEEEVYIFFHPEECFLQSLA